MYDLCSIYHTTCLVFIGLPHRLGYVREPAPNRDCPPGNASIREKSMPSLGEQLGRSAVPSRRAEHNYILTCLLAHLAQDGFPIYGQLGAGGVEMLVRILVDRRNELFSLLFCGLHPRYLVNITGFYYGEMWTRVSRRTPASVRRSSDARLVSLVLVSRRTRWVSLVL